MNRMNYLFLGVVENLILPLWCILPKSFLSNIRKSVNIMYESLAIQSYLIDNSDLGFFENFILGSEESKKLSDNLTFILNDCKEVDIDNPANKNALTGESGRNAQLCIFFKKQMVVEKLHEKGSIITYLGHRINRTNESLYQKLDSLNEKLSAKCI